jgi:subtilisin family serine protease
LWGCISSAPIARYAGVDGRGFAVAVLDTGIDLNHPAFGPDADANGVADRVVYQYDFINNDADASDGNGHGSNVAGIAAGQDATHKGVAPGANVIALKVLGDSGNGDFAAVERALQWLVANAAAYNLAAVNMSLTDGNNWASAQQLYGVEDEMAALKAKGVVVVSSNGNDYFGYQAQACPTRRPTRARSPSARCTTQRRPAQLRGRGDRPHDARPTASPASPSGPRCSAT